MAVCAGTRMQAQTAGSQNPPAQNPPAQPQSSSSQSQPTQAPTPQGADAQNSNYGVYISVDPLSRTCATTTATMCRWEWPTTT